MNPGLPSWPLKKKKSRIRHVIDKIIINKIPMRVKRKALWTNYYSADFFFTSSSAAFYARGAG